MSKIVVIGGTGTVGSQTVRELVMRDAEVRVMTRSTNRISELPQAPIGFCPPFASAQLRDAAG